MTLKAPATSGEAVSVVTSDVRRQTVGGEPCPCLIKEKSIMAENDESSLLKKAKQVGDQVAQAAGEVSRLKDVASHAAEDAVTEAKRLAKRGRYAAEDLVDDAAHRIKRDPLRSVALGLAIGLCMGMLTGWMVARVAKE
jgi:ElaB/YqjD/DUF883 family membrane-anchored ribosome-binding protein